MQSKEPIIRLRDVGVRYDNVIALEHVNIDIFNDDFIGIIGPNGGGKSSLVKMAAIQFLFQKSLLMTFFLQL